MPSQQFEKDKAHFYSVFKQAFLMNVERPTEIHQLKKM